MNILNFGSTNIDIIFSVDYIVKPGETIGSTAMTCSTGGKGANQSVGVAKAGGHAVYHAGKSGPDGLWIRDKLASMGVSTDYLTVGETPTGQAIIQVAKDGQNSIVLYPGANYEFTEEEIDSVLSHFSAGDWVMLQNEINNIAYIMKKSQEKGLSICFNPAPFDDSVLDLPLEHISLFVLNEVEAEGLSGYADVESAMDNLTKRFTESEIIITLGGSGVRYGKGSSIRYQFGTWDVPVVDTTAAGDTFIGCFVANRAKGKSAKESLEIASAASSVTVMREGAMDSIPTPDEFSLLDAYSLTE